MKVLVTGASGFIAKNLIPHLEELDKTEVITFIRNDSEQMLEELLASSDFVFHLAGENRPVSQEAFEQVNAGLTIKICEILHRTKNTIPLILTSSTQALLDNTYGRSKLAAEHAVTELSKTNGNPVVIYRLPGVFGKWCKPNYNSVVATFCHNIANDLPIQVNDPVKTIILVYIDDVISSFLGTLQTIQPGIQRKEVKPEYNVSLGDLAAQIEAFKHCRTSLVLERVGTGLTRALYATYVSYLPKERFTYSIPVHGDKRGIFVEMLKTKDSGQFSFFTAHPGVTRGRHYHNTKSEKFLVIKGKARFGFRHIITNEDYKIETSGDAPQIVETIPGCVHDITNIGNEEMIVMLWANEIYDPKKSDTIVSKS